MNKTVGLLLIAYSLLLIGLSYLAHYISPALAQPTLLTGLVGGALCLVWGGRAVAGSRGKALPILTLVAVSFTLLPQTFTAWFERSEGIQGGRMAAALISVLLVLSLVMLVRIAWAGVVFDLKADNLSKAPGAESKATGKLTARDVHDWERRRWRHLDSSQYQTIIEAEVPRVSCPKHGTQTVAVPWAERFSRFTRLFERLAIDVMGSVRWQERVRFWG